MIPINTTNGTPQGSRVAGALGAEDPSVRLRAALAVGSHPDPDLLETLVDRCAVEPDFFVRDMLSWALTRLSPEITLPRLRQELDSERPQARNQALHTLSKIGDERAWAWITCDLLRDADDEVARTAWRVAAALVPEDGKRDLADELVVQLGRGAADVQLSLSRALIDLGHGIEPALERAAADPDPAVAAHARATALLLQDPDTGFDAAIDEAKRVAALGPERAAAAAASGPAGTSVTVDAAGTAEPEEATESDEAAEAVRTAETADC